MAKATDRVVIKQAAPTDVWIERLTIALRTLDAMESEERAALLNLVKSKYSAEWPRSDY